MLISVSDQKKLKVGVVQLWHVPYWDAFMITLSQLQAQRFT